MLNFRRDTISICVVPVQNQTAVDANSCKPKRSPRDHKTRIATTRGSFLKLTHQIIYVRAETCADVKAAIVHRVPPIERQGQQQAQSPPCFFFVCIVLSIFFVFLSQSMCIIEVSVCCNNARCLLRKCSALVSITFFLNRVLRLLRCFELRTNCSRFERCLYVRHYNSAVAYLV